MNQPHLCTDRFQLSDSCLRGNHSIDHLNTVHAIYGAVPLPSIGAALQLFNRKSFSVLPLHGVINRTVQYIYGADVGPQGGSTRMRRQKWLWKQVLTIYGPMIYTAPYVMCLMGENPFQGPLEGLGHESQDFFWAQPF